MGGGAVTAGAGKDRLALWSNWASRERDRLAATRALLDASPRLRPMRADNDNDDDGGWVDGKDCGT